MNKKSINIIMDLERLKGEKITNINDYNNATQRQIVQNQQKMQLLKHKNDNIQTNHNFEIKSDSVEKSFDCGCGGN